MNFDTWCAVRAQEGDADSQEPMHLAVVQGGVKGGLLKAPPLPWLADTGCCRITVLDETARQGCIAQEDAAWPPRSSLPSLMRDGEPVRQAP